MKHWIVACALFQATTAFAQDVVGRGVVGGEPVDLLSDGTWQVSGAEVADGCSLVIESISFCGEFSGWTAVPAASAEIAAQYRFDARSYGMIIDEAVGSGDGITSEFMRETILLLAASRTGVERADIPVLDVFKTTLDGANAETVVYKVTLNGVEFVFVNTILLQKHQASQFITYTFGADWDDNARQLHDGFLSFIRLQ
jgi:hypothetical protein